MNFRFRHHNSDFNLQVMLTRLGILPTSPMYLDVSIMADKLVKTMLEASAKKLNKRLQSMYRKEMFSIFEYRNFPRYMRTMSKALSEEHHIEAYIDKSGLYQAKFVDTRKLGDLKDLQRVQKMVYPTGGTLRGWVQLYNSWMHDKSTKYAEIVNRRLDIMDSEGIAPFLELIEYGNGKSAYPTNSSHKVLNSFRPKYISEMNKVHINALVAIDKQFKALRMTQFPDISGDIINIGGVTKQGWRWVSKSGKNIFMLSGTERLIGGRVMARGFTLDNFGNVLRKWSGWIPK